MSASFVPSHFTHKYQVNTKEMETKCGNSTTILGHKFSSPFFISPAARQDMAHPDAELNLVRAAGENNILYVVWCLSPSAIFLEYKPF